MEYGNKKILSGALILGIGAFLSKLLGAIYRIPLTRVIGGTGLGLYQMIFPVYALLLDLSGAGVPNAVAKLISSYKGEDKEVYARKILKSSLIFFSFLGAVLSLFTGIFSNIIATAQGNSDAAFSYVCISPSIFIVCIICCFRGYFQGYMNMVHTAVSQIVEQTVKLVFGLLLAFAFLPDIKKSVGGAALAITLSELFALLYFIVVFAFRNRKTPHLKIKFYQSEFPSFLKNIFIYAIPIALTGILIPLSKVFDSFLIVNILSEYSNNATGLFGLFSGVALTIVGLPVAVCYGIATVAVPAVSSESSDKSSSGKKTLLLTVAISVPCALICAIFSPFIVDILYGYLPSEEKIVSVNLLRLTSPCIVLLSFLQTENAVLVGKGKPKAPILSMSVGIVVKTLLEVLLLFNSKIGIYGAAIALIACYFVADLINLLYLKNTVNDKSKANGYSQVKNRRYADCK